MFRQLKPDNGVSIGVDGNRRSLFRQLKSDKGVTQVSGAKACFVNNYGRHVLLCS